MLGILVAVGGGFLAHHLYQKHKASPAGQAAAARAAAQASARASQAAGRGTLRRRPLLTAGCDPIQLMDAAHRYGAEGYTAEARQLAHEADLARHMHREAIGLVERCRAGDQHALAMVKQIGENARRGHPRARLSASLIEKYSRAA